MEKGVGVLFGLYVSDSRRSVSTGVADRGVVCFIGLSILSTIIPWSGDEPWKARKKAEYEFLPFSPTVPRPLLRYLNLFRSYLRTPSKSKVVTTILHIMACLSILSALSLRPSTGLPVLDVAY